MQKFVNGIWVDCTQDDLAGGDQYRISVGNGGWQEQTYTESVVVPILPLTNVVIVGAEIAGAIYWAQEGVTLTITGDCDLPDSELIVMAEQVIDAKTVVSDSRFKATFALGKLSITARFDKSGNYMITQDRINRGLDRIGAGVHLSFDTLEFDIYV